MKKRLSSFYSKLEIRKKVTLPFVISFVLLWLSGTSLLGIYFSRRLISTKQELVESLASLVADSFEDEMQQLRQQARLIGANEPLVNAVEAQDITTLRQKLLPLNAVLQDDWIGVYNTNEELILELRKLELEDAELSTQLVVRQVLSGADFKTLIGAENQQNLSLLVGTAPLKSDGGIVGGILLGRQLSGSLLNRLSRELRVELIALKQDEVIAHSFDDLSAADVEAVQLQESSALTIGERRFFQARVSVEGIGGEPLTLLMLRDRATYERALMTVWVTVGLVGVGGAAIAIAVGYWTGRHIAQPIQALADAADQVSQQADFKVRIPVTSQDEVGTLARSLNQLIEWSGFYTQELETMNDTLEHKVQTRTEGLESALQDLKNTQLQLIQTEKMSSLGQMVAGIAHEINNPISFIKGNVSHLNGYFKDLCDLMDQYIETYEPTPAIEDTIKAIDLEFLLEDTQKILGSLNLGTNRVQDIVVAMRNFSRLDEAEVKAVDIHEGLESTLLILNNRLKYDIDIVKEYGELPLVECYPAQLNQVFTNIISNAVDAMEEADSDLKQITISTRVIAETEVEIAFKDSGPGMKAEVRNKIFDPFFTTKSVGKGTGLGLGICYQIVQKHAGDIQVLSELGQGTEFKITLPIYSTALKEAIHA